MHSELLTHEHGAIWSLRLRHRSNKLSFLESVSGCRRPCPLDCQSHWMNIIWGCCQLVSACLEFSLITCSHNSTLHCQHPQIHQFSHPTSLGMPPKPARLDWKTGEQLEFLLSRWETFKCAQDSGALCWFWPKVSEDWFARWLIPSSPSLVQEYGSIEEGRLMLQKDKNAVRMVVFPHCTPTTDLICV